MSWVCPDCTTDVSEPIKHIDVWKFCPFTGRPQGVLHVTPQEMQRRWDFAMERLQQLGDVSTFLVMGILRQWARGIDKTSYLGKGSGTDIIPDFPSDAAREAWQTGTQEIADLLRHTIEWKHHLVDLMTGERGQRSFDGRPMFPWLRKIKGVLRGAVEEE